MRNITNTVLYNWFQIVWNEGQFKDINVAVVDVISQDDMECAIVDVKATHIESDKQVAYSGISTIRVENGKAVETKNVFDTLKMYQQLGYELTENKS